MLTTQQTKVDLRDTPTIVRSRAESTSSLHYPTYDPAAALMRSLGNGFLQDAGTCYAPGWESGERQGCSLGSCRNCALRRVQTKLAVGQVGDTYEQEADRIANQVMATSSYVAIGLHAVKEPQVQRQCLKCEEQEKSDIFQAKAEAGADSSQHEGIVSMMKPLHGGEPLPDATRHYFESRFAQDFRQVRIHTGGEATAAAQAIKARAFTFGRNIVFGAGQYAPTTAAGQWLLAHELTHVVQQGATEGNYSVRQNDVNAKSVEITMTASKQVQRAVEDCSDLHREEVRTAIAAVPPAIRRTISAILGPADPAVETAMRRYFGASSLTGSYPASIGLRLAIIASRIGNADVECENPGSFMYDHFCGNALAYVRSVPAFFGIGSIHLCQPGFHNLAPQGQMATIVHEAAHRYNDADDEAYFDLDCSETAETRSLSDVDKRDNADSYGCLVYTLG